MAKGTSKSEAYGQYAASMSAAGQSGLDGRGAAPSKSSQSVSIGGGGSGGAGSSASGRGSVSAGSVSAGAGRGSSPGGPSISVGAGPGRGSSPGGPAISSGTDVGKGYQKAAQTMAAAGVRGVGGGLAEAAGVSAPSRADTAGRRAGSGGLMPSTAWGGPNATAQQNAWDRALGTIRSAEARKTDPYNSLVYGRNTPTHAKLTDMTVAEVMDYQRDMVKNGHASTAVGAYQITAPTMREAVDRAGIDPQTTKFDRATQDALARDLATNRAKQAARGGELDAEKFANSLANEWAAFANSSGKSAHDGDEVGNKSNTSYSTVTEIARGLIDTGAVTVEPVFADTPENAPTPTSRPSERAFAAAGVGASARGSGLIDLSGLRSDEPASTPAARRAGPAERFTETYLGGVTRSRVVSEYQYAGRTRAMAPAQPYERGVRDATGDQTPDMTREEYFGPEATIPRGNPPAPETETPPASTPETEPDRQTDNSTGRRVAAGAIDVGLGLIPGVGIAATGFNVLAGLTGNKTLGNRITGLFGEGNVGDYPLPEFAGEGESMPPPSAAQEDPAKKKEEEEDDRFTSIYLAPFNDPTKRPTPREKWGRRTSYGAREYA